MSNDLSIPTPDTDRSHDGKAMAGLSFKKRSFVLAMLQQGVNKKAAQRAAVECGYAPNYGYTLMRDEGVLAALREEATKRVTGAALVGINVMLDIAQDPTHKDQFRAAKELAGMNGFTAEQRIVVEHIGEDSKAQIRQIIEMANQLGLDPRQLISSAGIVDAEFTEVKEVEVDASDW